MLARVNHSGATSNAARIRTAVKAAELLVHSRQFDVPQITDRDRQAADHFQKRDLAAVEDERGAVASSLSGHRAGESPRSPAIPSRWVGRQAPRPAPAPLAPPGDQTRTSMEDHLVPDLELLQVGPDLEDIANPAAHEVLEALVGIEAAAASAELDEPRPHRRARGVDRDRVVVGPLGRRDQLVAGQAQRSLLLGRPQRRRHRQRSG
jgi:hypothetical protein